MPKTVRIEKNTFVAARNAALEAKQPTFKYKDVPFDTDFAKYLVEAMDNLKKESISVSYSESITHG